MLTKVAIPNVSPKLQDFPAKLPDCSAKQEIAQFGPLYSRRGKYNSAVEGAMTRPVHLRFWGDEDFLHGVPCDCSVTDTSIQQYRTDSSGAFSVGGHAHAHILGPARSQDCSDWI